jgi:magnesium transporter
VTADEDQKVLGLINLAQNGVLAVIFMPLTVIASIYGMNFNEMPELEQRFGYRLAIFPMIRAAVRPNLFFRWKKWL